MNPRPAISVSAPAKLNLALSVGSPDAKKMHPIASWMVTVSLCDELFIEALEPDSLSLYAILWHKEARRTSEIDWSITKDLAVRAHLAVESHVGKKLPIKMRLEKRIPVGGGLGGGSSNAAAMLRALNELFELKLPKNVLHEIATSLGSDVPFLIEGGSAVVTGLGEKLEAAPLPESLHAVLVLPAVACPTGAVYQTLDRLRPQGAAEVERVKKLSRLENIPHDAPFNDLALAACEVAPKLRGEMEELSELTSRVAHVSGSGSTLFVLTASALEAELLADAVSKHMGMPAIPVQGMATPAPLRPGSTQSRA
ncbi:MAG: 4-(cytidine 5'-diphospho)-2-C-methyl-D-erythritol kinase [Planctomycetes bacterium]|nr:4-(cytidine 5'-diphospho)-2-C-methyl-D-erythritol kinase [Planctomycetota bacterium]